MGIGLVVEVIWLIFYNLFAVCEVHRRLVSAKSLSIACWVRRVALRAGIVQMVYRATFDVEVARPATNLIRQRSLAVLILAALIEFLPNITPIRNVAFSWRWLYWPKRGWIWFILHLWFETHLFRGAERILILTLSVISSLISFVVLWLPVILMPHSLNSILLSV